MDSLGNANLVNCNLEQFYAAKLGMWKGLREEQAKQGRTLSVPLFVKVSSSFLLAKCKVVFVGQETHGWWTDYAGDVADITACEIMDFYEGAWLTLYQTYKRSFYWRAMRHIADRLQLNDPPRSFLYSNIFPCDVDRRRTPLALHDAFREWGILPHELNVLKPDYVVFFCGREYYGNLQKYFGKWPDQFVSTANPLVRYQPPGHNWKGFVTYHPAYLMRSKRWNLLDEIIRLIKADSDPTPKTEVAIKLTIGHLLAWE